MDPAERIKAALARPEARRHTAPPPVLEPKAEVESTLPLLGVSDEVRAVFTPSDAARNRASTNDFVPAAERGPASIPDEKARRSRRIYVAFGLFAVIVMSALLIRQRLISPARQSNVSQILQFDVRPETKGLYNVRWSPQAAPILNAREGRLVVLEGSQQQPKIVPLLAEDLKIGHVYYQSSVERLQFRLEVVDTSGAVIKESALAFSPAEAEAASAPAAPQTLQPQNVPEKTQNALSTKPKNELQASAAAPETAPPATTIPDPAQPSAPAPREFTPPPVKTPAVEQSAAVVLDPGSPLPTRITAPTRVNLPPINAAPPPSAKPSDVKAPSTRPSGGNVQPAMLVKKVAPAYPTIARTARVEGTVVFSALIDKNGRVQNVRTLSGPPMLIEAASEAVKKWVYRPMILDGRPTEVLTQIEVRFSLGQ